MLGLKRDTTFRVFTRQTREYEQALGGGCEGGRGWGGGQDVEVALMQDIIHVSKVPLQLWGGTLLFSSFLLSCRQPASDAEATAM